MPAFAPLPLKKERELNSSPFLRGIEGDLLEIFFVEVVKFSKDPHPLCSDIRAYSLK